MSRSGTARKALNTGVINTPPAISPGHPLPTTAKSEAFNPPVVIHPTDLAADKEKSYTETV
jgi:hypothetical protein